MNGLRQLYERKLEEDPDIKDKFLDAFNECREFDSDFIDKKVCVLFDQEVTGKDSLLSNLKALFKRLDDSEKKKLVGLLDYHYS